MRHAALAVLLLAIFLTSTLWVRSAIAHNAQTQQRLQKAQFERGRLLKLQLDEETGLRGYLATGSRVYLQPYDSARRGFTIMFVQLDRTVTDLGIDDTPVRRERELNAQWIAAVATPALTGARGAQSRTLRVGKSLVDAFRATDNRLTLAIQRRSKQLESSTNELVSRVLFGSFGLGIVIVLVVTGYGFAQNRLTRRLARSEVAYEKERKAVEALQDAFSRPQLPSFPNLHLSGAYAPARDERRVGGDWYDAYAITEQLLLFSIGDVSGHGLEAAVVMSRVRQSITTAALTDSDPAAVLRVANEVLLLQESRMATVACGFVDLDKRTMTYATAGHPPMLLVPRRGPVELLATGGPPLGVTANPPFRSTTLRIEHASALVLYTDGLTENGRDTVAGERALVEAVNKIDFASCEDPAQTLLASIFSGAAPNDDVAILTLTFARASVRPLRVLCA